MAGDSTLDEVDEPELPDGVGLNELVPVETVTGTLRGLFKGFDKYDESLLVGAVTDLSGDADHLYFSLAAAHANKKIKCVVWQSRRDDIGVELEPEMIVAVRGRLNYFEGGGYPSLEVGEAHAVGENAYWKRLAALEETLAEEGLFAPERKAAIPQFPARVAIVTAPGSDAEQDLIESIHTRYPTVNIDVFGSTVQGKSASSELVDAIEAADASDAEALIISRGGGSETALRPFNAEPVVRAAADCSTPTVAAIGHDADEPLIEQVSDHRAKTPTAAGAAVVEEQAELEEAVQNATAAIEEAFSSQQRRWLEREADAINRETRRLASQWLEIDQSIAEGYRAQWRKWQRGRATMIESESDRLTSDWLDETEAEIDRTAAQHITHWIETERLAIKSGFERSLAGNLRVWERDIESAYTGLRTDWIERTRADINQAVRTIDQEHTLATERTGNRRTRLILYGIITALIITVLVLLATLGGLL
ncbi:exodeoxyribonuclease VII large subunit [Halosegnis marinus]|uniref:Exodeoxyribonuclease VII large subunit n=2 Tax=Halosegnis marinus TaxID=3034023 RepID=A0ABD5ZT86_9EURY|nr:exodeoxyribonuclease VII large subunit [Halosegnis sp. DT85]